MNLHESGGLSEIDVDLDSVRNSYRGDFFHLGCCAFQINVPLEDCHLPIVPGL